MSSTMRRLALSASRQTVSVHRPYHHSTKLQIPYKKSQDRETLKPVSNENTKSGSDEDVAAQNDAAYNPKKTSPESQLDTAGAGNESNPLDASGANQGINKPMGDEKTAHNVGAGKETNKGGRSSGHSSQKKGRPGQTR